MANLPCKHSFLPCRLRLVVAPPSRSRWPVSPKVFKQKHRTAVEGGWSRLGVRLRRRSSQPVQVIPVSDSLNKNDCSCRTTCPHCLVSLPPTRHPCHPDGTREGLVETGDRAFAVQRRRGQDVVPARPDTGSLLPGRVRRRQVGKYMMSSCWADTVGYVHADGQLCIVRGRYGNVYRLLARGHRPT